MSAFPIEQFVINGKKLNAGKSVYTTVKMPGQSDVVIMAPDMNSLKAAFKRYAGRDHTFAPGLSGEVVFFDERRLKEALAEVVE